MLKFLANIRIHGSLNATEWFGFWIKFCKKRIDEISDILEELLNFKEMLKFLANIRIHRNQPIEWCKQR